jgi:hypothetical protein
MSSSWMWRCVGLVLTDVSEEPIASIFRVEHSSTSHKITFFIVTAVKASTLTNVKLFLTKKN